MFKISSFQRLPINQYKTSLKPEIGKFQNYRIFPSFINLKTFSYQDYNYSVTDGSGAGTPITIRSYMEPVRSYFFESVYIYNGFEFRLNYVHGQPILRKTGFTPHTIYQWHKMCSQIIKLSEVSPNGEIFVSADYGSRIEVSVPDNDYDVQFQIPGQLGSCSFSLEATIYDKEPVNWKAERKRYLPNFGGQIDIEDDE